MVKNKRFFLLLIILSLLLIVYAFHIKQAVIYSNLANFYYSKGNLQSSLKYYDKAFKKGYSNKSSREKYLDILKKTDLSLDNQKKLVELAEGEINDTVKLDTKYYIQEKMLEIHNKYPLNYIKQGAYNKKIIRWGNKKITYEFKNSYIVSDSFKQEIKNAFETWQNSNKSGITFEEVNNNPNIEIVFEQNNENKNIENGQKFVVAYTTPDILNNKLVRMNIKFYTKSPDGENFSNEQIYNTALHEIFHALGFTGHSFDKNNVMYMTKKNFNNTEERLKLSKADISTFELLYNIKPDITNSEENIGIYLPQFVIGSDKDINYAKHKEAKNYIVHAPTLPGGYIDLAHSFVEQKKYAQAIRALEKALSLSDSDDVKYIIYYNLSVSYYYIANYDIALNYLNYAKQLKDTEDIELLEAEIYRKQNNINKAIKSYENLNIKNPHNIDYVLILTDLYEEQHNYLKARNIIHTFIKNNPKEKNNKKFGLYKF